MNSVLKNIKGANDSLPNEQIVKNHIIDIMKETFENFGYLPLETTTLCTYELLSSKYAGGAEILKEIYTLKDQGNREIGLRYDLTVPFAKVIAMNSKKEITLPFRRYEIGKVFRDGPVKVGRVREFYQCDVDLCGLSGTYPEVEILSMASLLYKKLGINIEIQWNNRKLLSGLILEAGIKEEDVTKVILSVDKLAKIGKDGIKEELKEINIDNNKLDKLFSYFNLTIDKLDEINTNNEVLKEGIKEVKEVDYYLKELKLDECVFTPYLARGLEIYTSTIWEVFDKEKNVTSSIGAGGRYDKIITNFINDGNTCPAVGMTFGLVPIYEIVSKLQIEASFYDLFIIPMDTKIEALKLANKIRENNINVLIEMTDKKVKKSFEWANKNKVKYVIVLGEEEINSSIIKLKNMDSGKEFEVNINDIDKIVKIITSE